MAQRARDTTQAGSGRSESRKKHHLHERPAPTHRADEVVTPPPPGSEERLAPRPPAPEAVRGPHPGDRFAPLTAEHADLLARLDELSGFYGPERERIERWTALATALESHARAEEWALYPRVRRAAPTRDLAVRGLEDHARVRALLRRIDAKQGDDAELRGLLGDLAREVREHVAFEEGELMPLAVQVLGKGEVDRLVAAWVRQRRKLEPSVEDERVRPGPPGRRAARRRPPS